MQSAMTISRSVTRHTENIKCMLREGMEERYHDKKLKKGESGTTSTYLIG
jgi:hypothetical protein